jgi:hypothetical protein
LVVLKKPLSLYQIKQLNIKIMNTEQRISELEKELADVKRKASNEIYMLKEKVKYESKMKDAYIKSYREVSFK